MVRLWAVVCRCVWIRRPATVALRPLAVSSRRFRRCGALRCRWCRRWMPTTKRASRWPDCLRTEYETRLGSTLIACSLQACASSSWHMSESFDTWLKVPTPGPAIGKTCGCTAGVGNGACARCAPTPRRGTGLPSRHTRPERLHRSRRLTFQRFVLAGRDAIRPRPLKIPGRGRWWLAQAGHPALQHCWHSCCEPRALRDERLSARLPVAPGGRTSPLCGGRPFARSRPSACRTPTTRSRDGGLPVPPTAFHPLLDRGWGSRRLGQLSSRQHPFWIDSELSDGHLHAVDELVDTCRNLSPGDRRTLPVRREGRRDHPTGRAGSDRDGARVLERQRRELEGRRWRPARSGPTS
ncbi:hypothetical protein Kfla_1481 [Kribbella flavida DSM 17836]|uniref:Uncharacterized protein n=1 Tax=Kribbella flavida (strain DSM 17836 / JCM 10339 / NBRC 14399) TaxID=479435 RepID=D2PLF3_KRIFD|nr:hypothetical protein Kfla_1481 [Kribbella flavida DSM 17836]